jgi:hypothetical protein
VDCLLFHRLNLGLITLTGYVDVRQTRHFLAGNRVFPIPVETIRAFHAKVVLSTSTNLTFIA